MPDQIKTELINRICMTAAGYADIPMEEFRGKLILMMSDFDISVAETALTVYTLGKNERLLNIFLVSKTIAGLSKRTIDLYRKSLSAIFRRIGKDADTITHTDIQIYFAQRMSEGVKNVTLDNERHHLSSFYSWMCTQEYICKNPMTKIDKIKFISRKESSLSDMEIELLRSKIDTSMLSAMFEMLLSTGCRVSELTSIKYAEIDKDKVTILGKGNKYRTVYLNARAQLACEQYLSERRDNNPYLFPKRVPAEKVVKNSKNVARKEWYKNPKNVSEGAMDKSSVESKFRTLGKKAGVENVHPHRLRRTCATNALRKGMPIELVSKMLGHANIGTTQIYLDIKEEELEYAHKKYV